MIKKYKFLVQIMKRKSVLIIALTIAGAAIIVAIVFGIRNSTEADLKKKETYLLTSEENGMEEGSFKKYSKNADGTWSCEGNTYQYRLEIKGRMANASADSVFVYLSNIEEIPFDQAWKAAGFSSNSNDYFDVKDAVLVDWRTEP